MAGGRMTGGRGLMITHGYSSYSNRKADPGMRDAILKLLGTCRKDTYILYIKKSV